MKRTAIAVLLLATSASAGRGPRYSSGSGGISVSQTNTAVLFTDNVNGGSNSSFSATTVVVSSRSTSANTCYINFEQTTASATLDMPLVASGSWTVTRPGSQAMAGVGLICASGQTATFDVSAQ